MDVNIVLPKPHGKQKLILASKAKRKVICAGRRGGKTTLLASHSVEKFLAGERVVYGTPVAKQLKDYWGLVKKYLKPLINAGLIYKNETDKYLRWLHEDDDQAMISAQTAYDADTWRGGHGSVLIYDEYAFMHPSVWDVVGVPMLLDTGGEAWFISTPNRKNHFHSNYIRGLEENGRWASFHFTSYDNPHLDEDELKEIVKDMTEDNHKQEILAEFLDNEGAVFRNIAACHNAQPTKPEDHKGHSIVSGVDWAKKHDYTVISIGCADCQQELSLTRFNKIDYIYQRKLLENDWSKWNVEWGLGESNSIGEPNLELLQEGGIPIEGFDTTSASKKPLIENLALVLEREEMQFLNHKIAKAEMEAYEIGISKTGRVTYNAPAGVHDDTVIARALMCRAIFNRMPAMM